MAPPLSDVRPKPQAGNLVLEVPEEGPPFACNLAAAAFTFVVLSALEFFSSLYIISFSATLENTWQLLADILPYGPLADAMLGTVILTVIAIGLQLLQRHWRFPSWLPLALAWPTAWMLFAPSALEHADDWAPWMLVGTLAAAVFCLHWFSLQLAKEAWD